MKKIILLIIIIVLYQINFAQTTVLYDDFTSSSSLTNNWMLSGDPKPVWVSSAFGKTGLFDNNGDSWYGSSAYSKQTVGDINGFTISSEIYMNVTYQTGCWLQAGIGLTKSTNPPPVGATGDIQTGIVFSIVYDGDACWASPPQYQRHSWLNPYILSEDGTDEYPSEFQINGDQYANSWHIFEIVVSADRYVKFYCDKTLIWASTKRLDPSLMTNHNVVLGFRSSGVAGKAYHDWISVTANSTNDIVIIPNPKVTESISITNKLSDPSKQFGDGFLYSGLWGTISNEGQTEMNYDPGTGHLNVTNVLSKMNLKEGAGVAGYPSIQYGYSPNNDKYSNTNLIFPIRLGKLASISTYDNFWIVANYSLYNSNLNNPINFAYDIWLHPNSPPVNVDPQTIELMIWLYSNGMQPMQEKYSQFFDVNIPCLVDGVKQNLLFKIYYSPSPNNRGVIISFKLETSINNKLVGVDLSSIAKNLITYLPQFNPSWYQNTLNNYQLLDIELGSEFLPVRDILAPDLGLQANYNWTISNYYFRFPNNITSVNDIEYFDNKLPEHYFLGQNYPNPFNPTTKIKFDIPKQSHVKLVVYDILGRDVEKLVDREMLPGSYVETFHGTSFPSGVYFYRIEAGSFVETKKFVLMK